MTIIVTKEYKIRPIINSIMLRVSNNVKGGKRTIKKYSQMYNTLFDFENTRVSNDIANNTPYQYILKFPIEK